MSRMDPDGDAEEFLMSPESSEANIAEIRAPRQRLVFTDPAAFMWVVVITFLLG